MKKTCLMAKTNYSNAIRCASYICVATKEKGEEEGGRGGGDETPDWTPSSRSPRACVAQGGTVGGCARQRAPPIVTTEATHA
jgi:hypothetical protein